VLYKTEAINFRNMVVSHIGDLYCGSGIAEVNCTSEAIRRCQSSWL